MFKVEPNYCSCHPETCCCKDWKIVDELGNKHSTHMDKSVADSTVAIMNSREVKPTLVGTVLELGRQADALGDNRTLNSILGHAMSEMGETAIEVNIFQGTHRDKPGPDGVVGEAVDTILCMIDLIYKFDPSISEEELVAIAEMKGAKWIRNITPKPGPPWNVD